eukprot:gene20894-34486_t
MTDTSSTRWIVAAAAGYIAYRTYQHLKQTPSTAAAAATAAPPYPRQTTPVQPPPPLPQKRSIGGSGGAAAAATTATSNRPSPTITRLQSPPLLAETVTAATAEAKLLPPPVAVRSFLVQTNNNDEGGATGPDGELRHADAAAAAEWLAETAAAAHSSPKLKAAGRALLGLEARLAELGSSMAKANVALALKSTLGTTAVTAACKIRSSGPAESMSAPRQDEAMPQLAASFDWTDWAARPETIYAHALTLLAAALVPRFKASIAILSEEHAFMPAAINESATTDDSTRGSAAAADSAAAGSIGGSGESAAGSTLLKSFGSILRSTASAAMHRYETAPRPACNADLLRQAVSTATAAEALALLAAFASQHGGLTGLQCLPDLAGTAAAASRYNALPVVANALFAPGCTVRELVGSSKVQAVFAKLRDNMPADSGLHQEQWEADHDAAVAVLNSPQCTSERVALHCELKVVVGECGLLWHQMDEPRRILDAGVAMPTLCSIYGRPSAGLLATLEAAAMVGAVATVRRMLRVHSTELDAAAGAMDHERRQVQHALKVAVDRGHFPVVQELIAHASRMWTPDQLQLATSPLVLSAASAGNLEIVLLLCDTHIVPGLLRSGGETCNGSSSSSSKSAGTASLIAAAEAGHLDVLLALIRNGGADPKLPRLKDGTTPLWAAAMHGRANVVAALLDDLPAEMRCDPNHQRFKDKTTYNKPGAAAAAELLQQAG